MTALYRLGEHCKYGSLQTEMVKDRIVVGLRDRNLSERLQLEADLTLEKVITMACQSESVRKQQSVIRGDKSEIAMESSINVVNRQKSLPQSGVRSSKGKKYDNKPYRTNFVPGVESHLSMILKSAQLGM